MARMIAYTEHGDKTISILIDPKNASNAGGRIEYEVGDPQNWESPSGADVYVNIGLKRRGTIHEVGVDETCRFTLPDPPIG